MGRTWRQLERWEADTMPCASASHGDRYVTAWWHFESEDVGSYYCDDCKRRIEKNQTDFDAKRHRMADRHN